MASLLASCSRNAYATCIIVLLSAPFLLAAVVPLWGGDSYAYHLPQAQLIAESGRLFVNEHLQVPLHPQNYHLLYASALLIGDDRLANVVHTAAAIMSALGLYYLGRVWVGRTTALLACAIYVLLALSVHSGPRVLTTAYVGYGTVVFTSFAYHCLARAITHDSGRMLCLACFLMAISLGIKMQAWIGVPAFAALAVVAATRIRNPRTLACATAVALSVGGYWYVRNFQISGDPFHPLGGPWFGHWGWNATDLGELRAWVAENAGLEPMQWLLIAPAAVLPIFVTCRDRLLRAAALAPSVGLAVWAITSFHDRFLLSIAPIIALGSAFVVGNTVRGAWRRLAPKSSGAHYGTRALLPAARLLTACLCGLWAVVLVWEVARVGRESCGRVVCPTFPFAAPALHLLQSFGHEDWLRVHQLNLAPAGWYLGKDVIGARHGPARYKDLIALDGDGEAIKAYLTSFRRNALLASDRPSNDWPKNLLHTSPSFLEQFAFCGSQKHVSLYVLREALATKERSSSWPPAVCKGLPPVAKKAGGRPVPADQTIGH